MLAALEHDGQEGRGQQQPRQRAGGDAMSSGTLARFARRVSVTALLALAAVAPHGVGAARQGIDPRGFVLPSAASGPGVHTLPRGIAPDHARALLHSAAPGREPARGPGDVARMRRAEPPLVGPCATAGRSLGATPGPVAPVTASASSPREAGATRAFRGRPGRAGHPAHVARSPSNGVDFRATACGPGALS